MRAILEGLIAGRFFCPYSSREVYEQLRQPEFAAAIEAALRPFGRALAHLGEGDDVTAFFARYVDLSDSGDRREAMEELKCIRDQIMPVLDFIHLCGRAGQGDVCLSPGEEISFGGLLMHIDQFLVARDQLRDLCVYPMFTRVKVVEGNKEKLTVVFKVLVDAGYLVRKGVESSLYVATGKMGYLYHMVSWIADSQKLLPAEEPEADPSQGTGELL
ncbi:hypothetical protein DXT77_28820 [Pseudomonas sp. 91RF]|uniref:hypothetical protein n=1 Tax=Pseudomonas sp. 91RF TaxID=2292261 RepID=UPI000E66236E|nr:hypothetical protein [Pseudomonas sp. 91RF]RIJ06632.1 hypothetical protein DXT77_28820 [Pseudomonas sp. 91RF]